MTDTTATEPPESEREVPSRPATFLGRLGKALREQNWAAVVIEIGIVVLGVVIGFQVTAWGQARSDAARERVHLAQLDRDLRETEQQIETVEAAYAPILHAQTQMIRAYRRPNPPPPDSVVAWLSRSFKIVPLKPTSGTAEALVQTGELALIRDDSLRNAITMYLEFLRTEKYLIEGTGTFISEASIQAFRRMDFNELVGMSLPQAVIDSLALINPRFPLPSGPRKRPFPIQTEEILEDRELYNAIVLYSAAMSNLTGNRARTLTRTRELLAYLEEVRRS